MGRIPSLIAYPIFRLTVSMATGIFLFDRFSAGQGTLPAFFVLIGCLFAGMIFVFRKHAYRGRLWFGTLVSCWFLVFGGLRLVQEKQRVMYAWSGEKELYSGEVMTPPVWKGKTCQAEVCVETVYRQEDGQRVPKAVNRTILLYWMPDSLQPPLTCGDRVLFTSNIAVPSSNAALTGFDYGDYLSRKGISGTGMAFVGEWSNLLHEEGLTFRQQALACRNWIVDRYRDWQLGSEELAVVAALTVGDKSVLTSELKEIYSAAGVSHVLALSGLHIGILSALLYFLLAPIGRLRNGTKIRSLVVVVILWCFAFLSGLSPSVIRAVTMFSLYFLATCVSEERFTGIYALSLAAFLMLIYQPLYLFDLSFQLSFLAVASILFFYPLIAGCFSVKNRLLAWIWNAVSVSLSAQLGTLPLILYCFGTFPTYFLLANLIVGVLAVCVLGGALAALLLIPVPFLNTVSVEFLDFVTRLMNESMKWVEHLSGSQLTSLSISTSQALFGFLFLYGLYHYWTTRQARHLVEMLVALNLTVGFGIYYRSLPAESSLHFSNASLYLKQKNQVEKLTSPNGFYQVDTLRIGILNDSRWKDKYAEKKIEIHCLYLCRGFKGNIRSLARVFHIHEIILDTSLTDRYREALSKQCKEMKIPFKALSAQGSYRIFL